LNLEVSSDFDSLPRTSFMTKLEMNGFTRRMLRWLENWLDYQAQRVVPSVAKPKTLTRGVPQGSAVGPTVFYVSINTMFNGKDGTSCKFGDNNQPQRGNRRHTGFHWLSCSQHAQELPVQRKPRRLTRLWEYSATGVEAMNSCWIMGNSIQATG